MDPLVEALIHARKAHKLTQEHLAKQAGVSRRALVAIEAGGDCTLSTLRRLFRVLDMELRSVPAQHQPPTLDDVLAENEAAFHQSVRRHRT